MFFINPKKYFKEDTMDYLLALNIIALYIRVVKLENCAYDEIDYQEKWLKAHVIVIFVLHTVLIAS